MADYFLIFSAVLAIWAFLTLMGGERTRMLRDLKAQSANRTAPPNHGGADSQAATVLRSPPTAGSAPSANH